MISKRAKRRARGRQIEAMTRLRQSARSAVRRPYSSAALGLAVLFCATRPMTLRDRVPRMTIETVMGTDPAPAIDVQASEPAHA